MSKLILALRDKYAAVTVAAALLSDRLQEVNIDPAHADQLSYLLDVLLEMQADFGSQINLETTNAKSIITTDIK